MKDETRVFKAGELERLCKVIADTSSGLTGSEIGHVLSSIGVEDVDPGMTKWKRLYNALSNSQNTRKSGNKILSFISKALEPARFAGDSARYYSIIEDVNTVLSFHGLEFRDDGKFHKVSKSKTLGEAERRADTLKRTVADRNLHNELLEYCRAELLEDNYFHAVLEATKGIAEKIRQKTGLTVDGVELVDQAFGGQDPLLRINEYSTDTHHSEQRGFVNLLKGLFGTFRNPTAHAPRIAWNMEEQDALDLFTLASYVFRRIDNST